MNPKSFIRRILIRALTRLGGPECGTPSADLDVWTQP